MSIRAGWIVWMLTFACCWAARPELLHARDQSLNHGPFDGEFPAGGEGLAKDLPGQASTSPSATGAPQWALYGWVRFQRSPPGRSLIGGVGDPSSAGARYLGTEDGRVVLWNGTAVVAAGAKPINAGEWYFLAASSDGEATRLYVNGAEVARVAGEWAPGANAHPALSPILELAPRAGSGPPVTPPRKGVWPPVPGFAAPSGFAPFAGKIAGFTFAQAALAPKSLAALNAQRPNFDLINFESGSPTWPVQTRQMFGQVAPQPPSTLPKSAAGFSKPIAKPVNTEAPLKNIGIELWSANAWRLAAAPTVDADGSKISEAGFNTASWYAATVPGTVLTTLIDRGIYPDPDHGLNNLAIPESLNKQDYWYRTEFDAPNDLRGRRVTLNFGGINYAGEVWFNGSRVGATRGAFIRGVFDVTEKIKIGARNVIAVRVSPPPHPGLPHEESLTAGVGENGGMLALDGPTFIASEGWDWIPSVRDRNTGLWQGVTLSASGSVQIGDAQVVTKLDSPANQRAEIEIAVPLRNFAAAPVQVTLHAAFDDVAIDKTMTLEPGEQWVKLQPSEFKQLVVQNPKLWWPNGYGAPNLHDLTLSVALNARGAPATDAPTRNANGAPRESDRKSIRFGIRQITYELSLMDRSGDLRRVEVDLTQARARNERIVDVRHEAIHRVPEGWAASLYPGAEKSPAVRELQDASLSPYLVIKVNGVRIAAKGGNWGTDDWRKRISREKLEPYFKLHQLAHLNTIRNWVGQNTEDVFYDLADEYGLLVLNDFWASTQDYQLEPQDVPLFLENAADVIKRYRNHPSIALWFGRNEGVPQPILNEGLDRLVATLDGTRWYTGSSNRVNLQNSGPYNYREPATYFTEHARGFSVEVGTPSFPTLEAFQRAIPKSDLWPISDAWAYHDWHQSGNGDVKSFMTALESHYGAPTSFEDFERKAQMMNYVTHRAIFEGMNAHLWKATSGRLLWMTQPAWPSTMWQILSSDYDTHGSFYGTMKGSEPVHVQMNLPDHRVVLVNNTNAALSNVTIKARAFTLDNQLLSEQSATLNAPAIAVTPATKIDLGAPNITFVKLEARDASQQLLSENFYWLGDERRLNELPQANIEARATRVKDSVRITLKNTGRTAALNTKLGLFNADGSQVLPAYFEDNYINLLPGEIREVNVTFPASTARGSTTLAVRGWNVKSKSTRVVTGSR